MQTIGLLLTDRCMMPTDVEASTMSMRSIEMASSSSPALPSAVADEVTAQVVGQLGLLLLSSMTGPALEVEDDHQEVVGVLLQRCF